MKPNPYPWQQGDDRYSLLLFEIALALVRLDHIAPLYRKRESQHHVTG
jgi:hypothetical protein